jgi:D-aminopeptidase
MTQWTRFTLTFGCLMITIAFVFVSTGSAQVQNKQRARDLGIPFEGISGPLNAITDVAGIEVGHTTLISGNGRLVMGKGPVRTGVTAILPRGKRSFDPVFAAWFPLNGNGEMTGTTWIRESGFLEGPILITNTHSVGVVRDATIDWEIKNGRKFLFTYPIVAETYDGVLNDTNGFHVKPEHVFAALAGATSGRVAEGMSAAVQACFAMVSKGVSALHQELFNQPAGTRSGFLFNAITGAVATFALLVCP